MAVGPDRYSHDGGSIWSGVHFWLGNGAVLKSEVDEETMRSQRLLCANEKRMRHLATDGQTTGRRRWKQLLGQSTQPRSGSESDGIGLDNPLSTLFQSDHYRSRATVVVHRQGLGCAENQTRTGFSQETLGEEASEQPGMYLRCSLVCTQRR